jgi:hypothetical protein
MADELLGLLSGGLLLLSGSGHGFCYRLLHLLYDEMRSESPPWQGASWRYQSRRLRLLANKHDTTRCAGLQRQKRVLILLAIGQ